MLIFDISRVKFRGYICYKEIYAVREMQEISKIGVDLFFCLIISFLIIQATSSAPHNQELTNSLTRESARISADSFK